MSVTHNLPKSFGYAINGLQEAVKKEPNFRVHVVVAILVLTAAALFKFSGVEWLILLLTIGLVIILELVNTAIEGVVDLVSPDIKDAAKIAKDASAAAVLVASLAAVVVGLVLFIPKLIGFI